MVAKAIGRLAMDLGGWGLVAIAAVILLVLLVARALRKILVGAILSIIGGTLAWDWISRAVLGG